MSNKERRNKWLVGIGAVLFLLIAHQCGAQVNRIHRYSKTPSIVTLMPSKPMKFNGGHNDTIYVSITADSLGLKDYEYRLFLFLPKPRNIQEYSLEIGFEDNTSMVLFPSTTIPKYNFSEFEIDSAEIGRLRSVKFDLISFRTENVFEPCTNIKTKDYFTKFLSELK